MKIIRRVLIVICLVTVIVCGVLIIKDQMETKQADTFDDNIRNLYRPSGSAGFFFLPSACAEETQIPFHWEVEEEDTEPFPEPEDLPPVQQDFQQLLGLNGDTVGWITAGERIDGPVMFRDNEYYLDHNFYGEEDKQGAIFLNESCSVWPQGTIMLFHGHNLRSQGMFGSLSNFGKIDYVRQYPIVKYRSIYDEKERLYVIYSAFHASMWRESDAFFDVMEISFATDEAYDWFLTKTKRRSLWKSPVDVNTDDRLLELVTCNYIDDMGRFILLARELREDETEEMVHEMFR